MLGFDIKKIPVLGQISGWLSDNGFDYGGLVTIICLLLLYAAFSNSTTLGTSVISFLIALAPIWIPLMVFALFFSKWMEYTGKLYYLNQGRTTLRIKLPPEVQKSPEAMEFVLGQIHNVATADNLMQTYLDGKRPLTMSFEIVSIGGDVRFYVNLPSKKTKNAFEAVMYAQYPGVEIIEEPVDYTAEFKAEDEGTEYQMMSFHMNKKKDQEYPIKTYIDYGLDKLPKEEEKVDPITPMLELFGGIRPHERLFCQFVCTPFKTEKFSNGQLRLKESPNWFEKSKEAVNKIMQRGENAPAQTDPDSYERVTISPGERDLVAAIERNMDKYAYETGIRWIYITKDAFDGDLISPVIRTFSQYDAITRNAIGVRWRTDFDYKDLIPGKKKKSLTALKRQELKEYKLRKFFPKNLIGSPKIFTVEELATMFHLPGKVALTPTLGRVPSTRSQAPSNLPIGDL